MITKQEATEKLRHQEFWMTHPTPETIKECLDAGIDPNMTACHADYSYAKYPILTMAAEYAPETVPMLIKAGANVNQGDYQGETPVEAASYWSAIKPIALKYMLQAGADIKKETDTTMGCANPEGQAILDTLKSSFGFTLPSPGRLNCLGWLLSEGANMYDDPDDQAAEETRQKMRMLFEAGIDPNAPARYNQAPIFSTTCNRYVKATKIILECGGDPNVRNNEGNTPLIDMAHYMVDELRYAGPSDVYKRYGEILKLMLRYGADVTIQNPKGESFLSIAGHIPFAREMVQTIQADSGARVVQKHRTAIPKSKIDDYQNA